MNEHYRYDIKEKHKMMGHILSKRSFSGHVFKSLFSLIGTNDKKKLES